MSSKLSIDLQPTTVSAPLRLKLRRAGPNVGIDGNGVGRVPDDDEAYYGVFEFQCWSPCWQLSYEGNEA